MDSGRDGRRYGIALKIQWHREFQLFKERPFFIHLGKLIIFYFYLKRLILRDGEAERQGVSFGDTRRKLVLKFAH